ncbi:MAG: sulfite reductase subunit beta (hemoprotein) [Calditrichaeota bacterium]|nr:sulfite reductase subunit beta (hemoprotein) [Calditrichota bacterium]
MNVYQIPETLPKEIDHLENLIGKFQQGTLNETELKANRVPFGVYEQRQKGTYMVRVRCPGGIITPQQLKAVAEISGKFGSRNLHITTRQEIQIHDVDLNGIVPVIRSLYDVGLSSRGGGGNTIRNIMASWDSGIAHGEIFDVTPYAVALTERFIAESDSWTLPRKFKISFSNSKQDNAFAAVNDLGFIAEIRGGKPGFRVYVAGGMGRSPQVGQLLHDFIPDGEVYLVARAVKVLFDKYGNRKNRHTARLRFLWQKLGREKFIQLYQKEFAEAKNRKLQPLKLKEFENRAREHYDLRPADEKTPEFELWKKRYVRSQKQPGLYAVIIPIQLGILGVNEAIVFAEFAKHFGDNVIRFTPQQNISLRNIPEEYLGNVYRNVRRVTHLADQPFLLGNTIVCAGASTCQLGICRSRDALTALTKKLTDSGIDLDAFADMKVNISGCSNACGQHFLADLGFYGKVGRKNHISYPAYNIVVGAEIGKEEGARFAEKVEEISARNLPEFVAEFLAGYGEKKDSYDSFTSFLQNGGAEEVRSICQRYRPIPDFDEDKNYYFDWGAREVFSLAGRGQGECSAGLFDLIEMDLSEITELKKQLGEVAEEENRAEILYRITLLSSRMLLITRGIEASSDDEVFDAFARHFIQAKLIDSRFGSVIETAKSGKRARLTAIRQEALDLAEAVEALYHSMDDSLRFNTEIEEEKGEQGDETTAAGQEEKPHLIRDYRGVSCPMNFVKTKLDLSMMRKDQILEVLLDDGSPIENVPRSVANEGHEILRQKKIGQYWSVLIRKKA